MAWPRKPWKFADDAELKQLAATGIDLGQIAEKLGRSKASVEVRATALGVSLASRLPNPIEADED